LGGMDWIDVAQWRALVNVVMNHRFPWNVGKFLNSCIAGGFSRRAQLHGVSQSVSQLDELGLENGVMWKAGDRRSAADAGGREQFL
jgi:hypothetical protein